MVLTPTLKDVTPTRGEDKRREKSKAMWWGRGHLRRLTVFVRHENLVRLLEFLGYRVE